MGCDYYHINNVAIHFSDIDDSIGCLCTFPHNDNKHLDSDRIRSLAYLGAAVVLASKLKNKNQIYNFIPECLPKWIQKEIDKYFNVQ